MEKKELLYEGKAKKVYATEDKDLVIVSYKDDATALDGLKKGTIAGKGVINNRMSNYLMKLLEKSGVRTQLVEELSDRETVVKKLTIVPLEVIIRNISAGHFAQRYGVEEGIVFGEPTIEFSYKNDDLHDPLLNSYHAVALGLAAWDAIEIIMGLTSELDIFVMQSFLASVILYPVDSIVSLSNGEQAKVVKNNPGFMLRPNVVGIRSGRLYKLAEDISCASIVIL